MALAAREQVLFNPGPVNLHPAIKESLFNVELCHRQPEFEALLARVETRLSVAAGASPESHRLSLLHGSGSLAVDAALTSLVRGRVLVVDNGVYCRRIVATLAGAPGAEPIEHDAGLGQAPDLDRLEADVAARRPDWIAAVHHETTTGLLNPLAQIAAMAHEHGSRLFVDAVSSLGVHPVPSSADVVCFNSNKCLESLPGVAGVFWERGLESRATVPVLDVASYAGAMPSTPHVQAVVALDVALDLLAQEDRPARYARLARKVWETGGHLFEPLLAEEDRSHVLASFRLHGRDPDDVLGRALERGYVIYAGQGPLRSEIFRVANMGAAIDETVIEDLFEAIA